MNKYIAKGSGMKYLYKCQRCGNEQKSNDPPIIIHICKQCGYIDIHYVKKIAFDKSKK